MLEKTTISFLCNHELQVLSYCCLFKEPLILTNKNLLSRKSLIENLRGSLMYQHTPTR